MLTRDRSRSLHPLSVSISTSQRSRASRAAERRSSTAQPQGCKALDQLHDLSVPHGTVLHATERDARAGRSEYEQIRESVRESVVIYIEETGISVEGKQGWIWAFNTPEEALYVVSESRGSGVIIIRTLRSETGVFTFETLLSLLVPRDQQ